MMFDSYNKFEGFELSGVKDLELDEYTRAYIHVESAYKLGKGWTSRKDAEAFDKEMEKVFTAAGYTVVKGEREGFCDSLRDDGKTDVYMHPMEFTGVFRDGDVLKIQALLDSCETVNRTKIQYSNPLYKLDGETYRNMIYDDAERIAERILQYPKHQRYDAEFDFARVARIEFVGNTSSGFSSDHVDVSAVNEIKKYVIELEQSGIRAKDIPAMVGDTAQSWKMDRTESKAEILDRIGGINNDKDYAEYFKKITGLNLRDEKIIEGGIQFLDDYLNEMSTDRLKEAAQDSEKIVKGFIRDNKEAERG